MFRFGSNKGGPKPVAAALGGSGLPATEVRDALSHLLRLWLRATSLQEPENRSIDEGRQLRDRLERATVPQDFAEICAEIALLDGSLNLVDGGGLAQASQLARRLIDAAIPVARALEGDESAQGLRRVREACEDPRAEIAPRFASEMERVADGVRFVRRVSGVLRVSVIELVGVLSRLGGEDRLAGSRLQRIRQGLECATEIEELEQLRCALLQETDGLVMEVDQRVAQAERIDRAVEHAQAEIDRLQTALVRAESRARTDALTGLGNRVALEGQVRAWAKSPEPASVVAVDVDHFKAINDGYGHDVGDMAIRQVAAEVTTAFGSRSEAFRLGGDEFLVVVVGGSIEEVRDAAQNLCQRLASQPLMCGNHRVDVTLSMGATCWSDGTRFEAAAKRADQALYAAKAAGRGRVVAGQPD